MGIEESLKRSEVFLGLDDNELGQIAALPSCREETFQPGEVIFSVNDKAENLYVLKEGQVDLVMEIPPRHNQEAKSVVIDRITTGDIFGWSSLVGPYTRVMPAVCRKHCQVVVINGTELMELFERNHHIGYKILQSLSHIIGARLRYMEQALFKGQRWPFLEKRIGL